MLTPAILDIEQRLRWSGERLQRLQTEVDVKKSDVDVLKESDLVLRALLKQRTTEAFREVEVLLLKGLQTVFGPEWTAVRIDTTQKHGRLWGELTLVKQGPDGVIEGSPLDSFGGGPVSLISFLLRFLVVRRTGLAPLLILDETFSQVSADYLPAVSKFLRLMVDRLGMTLLLVTHRPALAESATRVYRAVKEGTEARFEVEG